jgi:RES domain-containing protein
VYTSAHLSLAVLEVLVHADWSELEVPFEAVEIEIPDDSADEVTLSQLPSNWRLPEPNARLTEVGAQWCRSARSLVLRVPSAVVPQEHNLLLNPDHARFAEVAIRAHHEFRFDSRLAR